MNFRIKHDLSTAAALSMLFMAFGPATQAESPATESGHGGKLYLASEQPTGGHNAAPAPSTGGHGAAPSAKRSSILSGLSGAPTAKSSGGYATSWGYSGATGPDRWGNLKAEYSLCKTGTMQSPIDIAAATDAGLPKIEFDYRIGLLKIKNNGHTIQVDVAKGSGISVDGKRFELLQFHFHTPSEHMVGGKQFPIEMHLVHKNAAGALAVVGVTMEAGEENLALQEVAAHLPKSAGQAMTVAGVAVNPGDLLPRNQDYFRYMGSLTTPPCSEGVNWYMMKTPIHIGIGQLSAFSAILGHNARPTQRLRNRLLMSTR